MPQKMTREDAIKQFGLHYEPGLSALDLRLQRPTSLAGRIAELAERKVSNTITLVESLGPATETFHFRTIEEAAAHLVANRRAELEKRRDAIKDLLANDEAAALKAAPASRNLSAVFETAAQALKTIDQALAQEFTIKVNALKDELSLPSPLLNVGDTVHVLRKTSGLPVLTTETVAARDMRGSLPFAGALDVSVNYIFGKNSAAVPEKNSATFVFATESNDKSPAGVIAAGANILAFTRAKDAKAAMRDIVSNKLEQLDAERQSLINALRNEGLSPRRKPRSPKN
ncbi:MAG: hypothetical protein Q8K65_11910 [Alphaproteobacteria bacterium]|nr:hypothetical protein [Alphaproteobacteria bacterium]